MEEIRVCICGCGEKFKCWYLSKRKYIQGHALKGKSKIISQKTKDKISKKLKGNIPHNKGITNIKRYGKKKAQQIKEQHSKTLKGITLERRYGKEKAYEIRKHQSYIHMGINKGITNIKRYGKKKAQQIKEQHSKALKGKYIKWTKEKQILAFKNIKFIRKAEWNKFVNLGILPAAVTVRKHFGSFQNLEELAEKYFLPKRKKYNKEGFIEREGIEYYQRKWGIPFEDRNVSIMCNNGKIYKPDGRNKEFNIFLEWDEPHHEYQKEKDWIRQKAIVDTYGGNFIRVKQKDYLQAINQTTVDDFITEVT